MRENTERNWVLVLYGLYLLGVPTGGFTTLIGVILAHLRWQEAKGTAYESHYRNLILVFWVWLGVVALASIMTFAGILSAVFSLMLTWPGFPLALVPAGLTIWVMMLTVTVACLWYYWRLLRGLMLAIDDRPYGTAVVSA